MIETEETIGELPSYSRRTRQAGRRRRGNPNIVQINESFKENLLPVRFWPALLWSIVLSFLSVANPFLTGLANNLQSQTLYAGLAMSSGQNPYSGFFGTSGILYYILVYIGSLLKTTIGLAVFQFIALFIAGIYFYKITAYFSKSQGVADQLTTWFYLFILAAGFGGVYASLFALPFLMTSLWLLIRYFENAVRDEIFILYGLEAAVAFMIYPKSIFLWVVATLVLIVFNIRYQRKARGVYQFLASLFGFLLILYSVGYYTFVQQILGLAIRETFFYNLSLDFTNDAVLWTIVIVMVALLVSGFLQQFIQTLLSFKEGKHSYIKAIILLVFLAELVFIVGNPHFEWSQLVMLVPYGLIMATLTLKEKPNGMEVVFDYLKMSFFLPLLICIYIPLQPIITYVQEGQNNKERVEVANYIKENAAADATIYTWDNSAQIYLKTERLSAATIITATPYLYTSDNQATLSFDLNKNQAQFIVVNSKVALLDSVKSNLEQNYTVVDIGTTNLVLYQKN